MADYPLLIIKRDELIKHREELEKELNSKDNIDRRVAEALLENLLINSHVDNFDGTDIVLIQPELTFFNKQVRKKLDDLDVYYSEHIF